MNVTETMIQAYFKDELDANGQALVEEYFRQYPERLQYHLTDQSWEDFPGPETMDPVVSDKMLEVISSATYGKGRVRKMIYRWASVAAALFIVIAGIFLLTGRRPKSDPTPVQAVAAVPARDMEWMTDSNGTDKMLRLSLEDGSVVELSKGSRIRYQKHFESDARNIWLRGSALFDVGKDKARAFTVHAERFDVTALGTVFRIDRSADNDDRGTMEVSLLSGRIMVNPDSLLAIKGLKAVYMQPGQTLVLNRQLGSMAFARPAAKARKAGGGALSKITTLTFNNQPLINILDTLKAAYGLKLIYRQELLKDMRFTGVFNSRQETLESFLGTLAVLYNLTIKQDKNTIRITQ